MHVRAYLTTEESWLKLSRGFPFPTAWLIRWRWKYKQLGAFVQFRDQQLHMPRPAGVGTKLECLFCLPFCRENA